MESVRRLKPGILESTNTPKDPQRPSTPPQGRKSALLTASAISSLISEPSRLTQAQPAFPPTPFIFSSAQARIPPNDPARAAPPKRIATRQCRSCRL